MIKPLLLIFLVMHSVNSCYTLCDTCTDTGLKCITCKDFATHSSLAQCACIDGYIFIMSNSCIPTRIFVGALLGSILGCLMICIFCVCCFKRNKNQILVSPEIKKMPNQQNQQASSEAEIKIKKGIKNLPVKNQKKKLNELKVTSTHSSFVSTRAEYVDSSNTMGILLKNDQAVQPLSNITQCCILCDQLKINYITNCGHQFHLECLKSWQLQNGKCPICEHALEQLK